MIYQRDSFIENNENVSYFQWIIRDVFSKWSEHYKYFYSTSIVKDENGNIEKYGCIDEITNKEMSSTACIINIHKLNQNDTNSNIYSVINNENNENYNLISNEKNSSNCINNLVIKSSTTDSSSVRNFLKDEIDNNFINSSSHKSKN
ncbi:hypothetical protein PIROE2DRAFT_6174 [Piromyces sp. E2]|nr:hypothetical protein PIROE2DRAFT_6174 [Piromyces sp. E2]|eukprot:OUM66553.1 hypothetical protein PIROE2DRAFT_6174 [Piromyces sp. E2]